LICGAGDEEAKKAMEVYCYRLKKYIGGYAAVMGGVDVAKAWSFLA